MGHIWSHFFNFVFSKIGKESGVPQLHHIVIDPNF